MCPRVAASATEIGKPGWLFLERCLIAKFNGFQKRPAGHVFTFRCWA